MATPVLLYRNIFRTTGAVITNSGTEAGDYSTDYVKDYRAYAYWKGNVLTSPQWIELDAGTPVTADSILLVNHNIVANAGQVKVYADTTPAPAGVAQALYTPTSDICDYKPFAALTKRYWRVEFSDPAPPFTSKPFVGEILLGTKLDVGEYVAPDVDPRLHGIDVTSARSKGGHFLGAMLAGVTRRGTLRFGGEVGVDRATFTSDLNDFLQNHYRKLLPFGLVFDTADSEFAKAFYLMKPKDADTPTLPAANSYARFRFDIAVEEAIREAA